MKIQILKFALPLLTLLPAAVHADESEVLITDPLMAEYSLFSLWPSSKQITYLRELRTAWSNFELNRKIYRGHAVLRSDPNRGSDGALCVIGGRERATVAGPGGRRLCPTRDLACDGRADDTFQCGAIYNNACVPREDIETLTQRCHNGAGDPLLTPERYEQYRGSAMRIKETCESGGYGPRFENNCKLFIFRSQAITRQHSGLRAPASPLIVERPPAPASAPARVCHPTKTFQVKFSPGGEVDAYIRQARRYAREGHKVEILGPCLSACEQFFAQVPKDRICVGPRASLGFHQASQDGVTPDLFATAQIVRDTYTPELREMWRRHYSPSLRMNYAHSRELSQYYGYCGSSRDICAQERRGHRQPANSSSGSRDYAEAVR